MPIPTRDEIRRRAIEIWMKRYGAKIGVYTVPSDEELMETSVWTEAQLELMKDELTRLEEMMERATAEELQYIMDEIGRLYDIISEMEEEVKRAVEEKARARATIPRTLYEALRDMQIEGIIYRFTVYKNRVVIDLHPRFIDVVKQRLFQHGVRDVDVKTVRTTLARLSFNLPVVEYPTMSDVRAKLSELETMIGELAVQEKITPEEEMSLYERLNSIKRRLERMEISPRQAMDELSGIEYLIERYRERPAPPKPPEVAPPPTPPPPPPEEKPTEIPAKEITRAVRKVVREEFKRLFTVITREAGGGTPLPQKVEVVLRVTPKGRTIVALDDYAERVILFAIRTAFHRPEYLDEGYYITGYENGAPADVYIKLYGRMLAPYTWWQWFAHIIRYVRENYDTLYGYLMRGYKIYFTYPSTTPVITR